MRHAATSAIQILFTATLCLLVWDVQSKIDLALDIETMTIQQEIEVTCLKTVYNSEACGAEITIVTCRMEGESFAATKARHQAAVAEAKAECPEGD